MNHCLPVTVENGGILTFRRMLWKFQSILVDIASLDSVLEVMMQEFRFSGNLRNLITRENAVNSTLLNSMDRL
jgi:hypothetical protein